MRDMLPFNADGEYLQNEYEKQIRSMNGESEEAEGTVLDVGDIPKALDIYYRT